MVSSPPLWDGTDFSPDFRVRILNGLIPLIFACLSFGILFLTWSIKRIYKAIKRRRRRQRLHSIGGLSHSSHARHGVNNNTTTSSSSASSTNAPHTRFSSSADEHDAGGGVPLPQVIIETEAEHDSNDSHDLMLEAENAVIRAQVKNQGIVWPGAFKALGMLKEKEDHHLKPNRFPSKYLAVPGEETILHDNDSWIQWWKAPRKSMKKTGKKLFGGGGNNSKILKSRRKKWTWRKLGSKLLKQGKKDFIQALLAWAVVGVLFSKGIFMRDVHTFWKWMAGIAWAYFTILLEIRQYTALLHRSPFRTRKYDKLSFHVAPFMLGMTLLSLLELRSVLLHHKDIKEMIGLQSAATILTLIILLMEILTPRPSNFIRKSTILEARSREASADGNGNGAAFTNGRRSASPASYVDDESDERSSLLPHSRRATADYEDTDEDLTEDEEVLAALEMLDDDASIVDSSREKDKVLPPPEVGASIFSLATFTYIGNFMFKHARTPATFEDVPDLRADDKAASVVLEFRAACKTYPRWLRRRGQSGMRKRPPIVLQISWYLWPQILTMLSWAFVRPWMSVLPPIFINLILKWTAERQKGHEAKAHVALLYVAGLFISQMASSLCMSQALIIGRRLCIRAKALIIAEVFTKSLRRKDLAGKALVQGEKEPKDADSKPEAEDEGPASAGRIQNLVSVDASRVAEQFAYLHFFFPEAPITIIVALAMLFKLIGFSAFAAVAAMLCLTPYQSTVARLFMKYQNEVLNAADDRLTLTTEVFQAIKVLKFFAWEKKFAEKLAEKRAIELVALRKRVVVFAMGGVALFGAPTVIALSTFLFHTKILHQPLDAATAFTSLALFNVIRSPLEQLADTASQLIAALVSCARVDALLDEEETAKYAVIAKPSTASDPKIGFVNAAFTWADADSALDDSNVFKLKNLNLNFVIDGLNLIVGPVGSGKSSLLYALLGEMNLLQGRCFLPSPIVREAGLDPAEELTDTVAFCSQTPWLLNDTIRSNIVFGSAYNAKRYKRVLHACALIPDLETLELGDKTEVGEKGTVLSGGQKARISLARAVYSSAKVILLDDVLSAVDAHTARHLYNHCLTSDKLMRGRTRILVTHALHLTIPCADYMVALVNGHVAFDGPAVDYVVASGANTPGLAVGQDFSSLNLKGLSEKGFEKPPIPTDVVQEAAAEQAFEKALPHLDEDPLSQEVLLSKAEKSSTGAVEFGVYTFYGKAFGSLPILLAMIAVIGITEAVSVSTNWSLRLWASSFDNLVDEVKSFLLVHTTTVKDIVPREPDYYLKRYVAFAVGSLFLFGARMLFFLYRGTVASKIIYNSVIKTLLAAPVRFYDSTPNGRIMNRLSTDMETIDQDVPSSLMFFVLEVFGTTSVIVAIAIAFPTFLIGGALISMAYALLGWLYITSSRELKRIEAVTRSPVYSLVGESLMGVTSIRAYSDSSRFTSKLFDLLDNTNRPFFALWLTNRWLSIRSDLGGACFALLTGFFIVGTPSVSASLAGFALTYSIIMEERILWILRLFASTQINMNSVERIREYTLDIAQETQGGKEPPAHWPSNETGIEVDNLVIKYAENLQPALKGVSFSVKPSERVAIVGRTGSGKSTLALSFFRFVEAFKGRIIIDGIDIATLPLHTLRGRLTVIPQDAALFTGTVRFNLDPFGQYSDAELYDVLRRTNLLNTRNASTTDTTPPNESTSNARYPTANGEVSTKTSGITSLDDKVQEGAKNFSAGQRQLLCLARGLLKLRESNILVLDESTANLDAETDLIIQRTIREEIGDKNVTVLCIAHRLHTIIDFDRVLVLSHGEVVEYDTPSNLLSKGETGSEFAKLCKETGEFDKLKEIADGAR